MWPVAWSAILRVTHANSFFVDARVTAFPVSQGIGSGAADLQPSTPLRSEVD